MTSPCRPACVFLKKMTRTLTPEKDGIRAMINKCNVTLSGA